MYTYIHVLLLQIFIIILMCLYVILHYCDIQLEI